MNFASQFSSPVRQHAGVTGMLTLFAALVVAAFAFVRMLPVPGMTVELRLVADAPGRIQWFYDVGRGLSEQDSIARPLSRGANHLSFSFPAGTYAALRLDPIDSDQGVVIESLAVMSGSVSDPARLRLDAIAAAANATATRLPNGTLRVQPDAGTRDPQLTIALGQPLVVDAAPGRWARDLCAASLLALLAMLVLRAGADAGRASPVVAAFAVVLVLIVTLNAISPANLELHPDERLHFACFSFFVDHFWPGAVDDPALVRSLISSPFGYSYLNEFDVVYFIASHALSPFSTLLGSDLAAARFFQTTLWAILLLLALRRRAWAMTAAVLLASPQVWYVFTYFNGDAFPLFLAIVAAMLVVDPDGGVRAWLEERSRPNLAVAALALCLGLLLVSKSNYLPLVPGLLLWLGVSHVAIRSREIVASIGALACLGVASFAGKVPAFAAAHAKEIALAAGLALGAAGAASVVMRLRRDTTLRQPALRLALLVAAAVVCALPRVVADVALNGSPAHKATLVTAAAEKYAIPDLKPSTLARGEGYATATLAAKGTPLADMLFAPYFWLAKSAATAFGVYGYMAHWTPDRRYYVLAGLAALLLVGAAAFRLWRERGAHGRRHVLVAAGIAGLVLLSSMLYSWIVGLQPQGRYLLPMLGMAALLVGASTVRETPWIMKLALGAAFALGAYSYIFVAIRGFAASP